MSKYNKRKNRSPQAKAALKASLRERDGDNCYYCTRLMCFKVRHVAIGTTATVEHLVKRQDGGGDAHSNMVLACWDCNTKRGSNSVDSWRYLRRKAFERGDLF